MIQDNKTAPHSEDLSEWSYIVRCITTKYADFSGRARRKEWWSFILFQTLIFIALIILFAATSEVVRIFDSDTMQYMSQNPDEEDHIDSLMGGNVFFWTMKIVGFLMLVPTLAVGCRRFHDVGISTGLFWVVGGLTILNIIVRALSVISPGLCAQAMTNIISTISMLTGLVMLVVAFTPGKTGPNAYGPDPKPPPPIRATVKRAKTATPPHRARTSPSGATSSAASRRSTPTSPVGRAARSGGALSSSRHSSS